MNIQDYSEKRLFAFDFVNGSFISGTLSYLFFQAVRSVSSEYQYLNFKIISNLHIGTWPIGFPIFHYLERKYSKRNTEKMDAISFKNGINTGIAVQLFNQLFSNSVIDKMTPNNYLFNLQIIFRGFLFAAIHQGLFFGFYLGGFECAKKYFNLNYQNHSIKIFMLALINTFITSIIILPIQKFRIAFLSSNLTSSEFLLCFISNPKQFLTLICQSQPEFKKVVFAEKGWLQQSLILALFDKVRQYYIMKNGQ